MMAVITNVIKICVKCTLLVIFALTGGEMMRHTVKIIICFALLGFSIMMPAQTLPVFPKDGAVTTGCKNTDRFYCCLFHTTDYISAANTLARFIFE